MSGWSDQLFSGQSGGAPVSCARNPAEEPGCVGGGGGGGGGGGLEELDLPELWSRELGFQAESHVPSDNGLAAVTSDLFAASSPSALANGLHLQRRLGLGAQLRNMQTQVDPDVDPQAVSQDSCGRMEVDALAGSEPSRTLAPEAARAASPQPLSLAVNQPAAQVPATEKDLPPALCPAGQNQMADSSPLPVEAEKKYALRSSGRPRFPCHLRKSSRLRRGAEDGERKAAKEEEAEEEKMWRVREEVAEKQQPLPVAAVLPAAPCPAAVPLALTVHKPAPKSIHKPGPRPGHKPGPKSRSKPAPKPVQKAAPKSVMRRRQAAQAMAQRAAPHPPFVNTSSIAAALSTVKEEPALGLCPPNNRKCRRFVGVRRIVVKVARIPVSLSRRQKSYKISNMETVTGPEKASDGGVEGSDVIREPTALLRMKNNGKSVMVMFPPGELPVILKRRRGRPPKQALPVIPGEPATGGGGGTTTGAAAGDQPKKPRRRRRTKLPCPLPSYVNDTNDVKTEYGDVLSKLAFLNRQPPATGRCSPPRCWTPSEPESFHVPLENPGISTLLHRLTGSRRPRGSRGGGAGRGGGAAGGAGAGERNKSTFSDFFESIGKKRKLSPVSEHGLPRKRGKGVGGVGRGGGMVGTEPGGGEKVRKRRPRKNGTFKGDGASVGGDWPNGAGGWGDEGCMEKEKGFGGFQLCGSPRGGFSSCELGRGSGFGSPGGGRGPAGEDSQGLFAGYFRSLLDSDDSSDLLDTSSQPDARKASSGPGFEPSSPAAAHSWTPGFSKWCSKGGGSGAEGSAQAHCSPARPPYNYGSGLAQTSPTTSTYPKSTPPSLSHSPSSPHPASYGHFPSGYSSSSPAASQRSSDCSFAYGGGGKALGHIGYSNYQAAAKRGFCGYPGAGPTSPGGGYMSVARGSPFSPLSEGYKQYSSNQWSFRQGFGGWSADGFVPQYGYGEYGSNESKDILDISNYTPQKAKRPPFPESLSESSSDSSHLGSAAASGPVSAAAAAATFRQMEASSAGGDGGQSSLSSLEKLMMDWHESASGPSYNWSQSVLFQGPGTSKPGRGRRKRTEPQPDKEAVSTLHSDSQSSPSPTPAPGTKRGGAGGRGRGSRGGRGGLSPCQRERPKGRGKASQGGPEGSGLFQEVLDYYSGDSSSLSPLATPNPAPAPNYLQDPCEYPSPYSAHPSTPSSEERYPALYPGESSSSLSPGISSPPYPPKPTPPPPAQSFHPSRTFSPSCSPSPRVTSHCSTALSPSHRPPPPPKDAQFSQYDSPSYCSSPYWYGQTSHSGSPSPHANTALHTHASPHANAHGGNPNAHVVPTPHDTHHHNTHLASHLQSGPLAVNNQSHHNAHAGLAGPSPGLLPHAAAAALYEERSPPSAAAMSALKRDLSLHPMSTGLRPGPLPHSSYPKSPLDSSPHQEDTGGFSLSHQSFQGMGHRYPSQMAQGGGVLCQLLDPASDESFSVTSL